MFRLPLGTRDLTWLQGASVIDRGHRRGAVGFSVHTGWAVGVAIVGRAESPSIVVRRRVELCARREDKGVYHRAEEAPLVEATRLVERASSDARARADGALDDLAQSVALVAIG